MRVVAAVAVLGLSIADADPARDQDKAAAEALGNEGRRLKDPQRMVDCGQAYVDLYNKDPVAPDFEEILVKAGQCYDEGRAIGPALIVYRLVERYSQAKGSPFVATALARMGALYEQVGMLQQAADSFEKLATKYPTDAVAKTALVEAVRLRGIAGDAVAYGKTVAMFEQRHAPTDPAKAAELSLAVLPERARDRVPYLRKHVAAYDKAGDEVSARARALLGEALWESACPTTGVDGVCLDDPRARAVSRCVAPAVVKRDAKLVEESRAMFAEAERRFGRATLSVEGQRGRARMRIAIADQALEAALGGAGQLTKVEAGYAALASDPATAIAAQARTGRLWQVLAFRTCERPDPALLARAIAAYDSCLAKASQLGVIDDWSRRCVRERAVLDPATAAMTQELLPDLPLEISVVPERPIAPGPDQRLAYKDALGKLAKLVERPAPAAQCEAMAKTFFDLARTDERADVHAMAGLAYGHCNLVDKAKKAYATALKLEPAHAISHSALGELAYRAGKHDEARKQWDAAVKANGKLFGARLGVAAMEVREMRAANSAGKRQLAEDAMFHAANASAVAPESNAPFLAMAIAALGKGDLKLASYFAARTTAIAPAMDSQLVEGSVLAARGDPGALSILERTAKAGSDVAKLALGLHQLALRRYADAAATLASIKIATYEVAMAQGIAARGLGKLADAEAKYATASLLDLKRPEAHFNLGVLAKEYVAGRTKDPAIAKAALVKAAAAFRRANTPEARTLADDCDRTAARL